MGSNRIDVILELIDATLAECAEPAFATSSASPAPQGADTTPRALDRAMDADAA